MRKPPYVPDRGDIVWLRFNPQAGHEQAGHRPALVLSPASYNRASDLILYCPMTSHKKGYPFEVVVTDEPDHKSVVLADQAKSLDWKIRKAIKKGTVSLTQSQKPLIISMHYPRPVSREANATTSRRACRQNRNV